MKQTFFLTLSFFLFSFYSAFAYHDSRIRMTTDVTRNISDDIPPTVYDTIMYNIRNVIWNDASDDVSGLDAEVAGYMNTLQSDGSWSDVPYSSTSQTNWQPATHLSRLKSMATAYTYEQSSYYQNATLAADINLALQYWYDTNPTSTNWYNQQIRCPQYIGEILILMRSGLVSVPSTLEDNLLTRMANTGGSPSSWSSSNKTNVAIHYIYRGCLRQDASVLNTGVTQALQPVGYFSPSYGLQYDLSYQEHGNQLYIGNYGYEFYDNISNLALYLVNSSYALQGSQLEAYSNFVRKTYLPVIRGKYYSFIVPGRQIAIQGNLNRAGQAATLDRMISVDPSNTVYYQQAKARLNGSQPASYGITPAHTHYWISDYSTHLRPNYSFDVRMVSTRTVRTENVNNENKKGHFLADGATNMQISGDEYYNVFPTWDWTKVPGTTAPALATLSDMTVNSSGGPAGTTTFVGGVSDSVYGASVYDMNFSKFDVAAQKAWFFFDDEIVCLGNSISTSTDQALTTTVNQALTNGAVSYGLKDDNSIHTLDLESTSEFADSTLQWVLHNGFGYYFPQSGDITVANKAQSGTWSNIATGQSSDLVTQNVFSLWFNHGQKPSNGAYAYVVVPNISSATSLQNYISQKNIDVAVNTDSMQVVHHHGLNMWQMVFYKAKVKYENDSVAFWTSSPVVVMVKKTAAGVYTLHVADPTQALSSVTIYAKLPGIEGVKYVNVALPTGNYKGESVAAVLDASADDYVDETADSGAYVTTTLTPVDDAYINAVSTTYNYGASSSILVKNNSSSNTTNMRYGLLKFDLSRIDTVTSGAVVKAEVRMAIRSVNSTSTLTSFGWDLWHIADGYDSWAEGTMDGSSNDGNPYSSGVTWKNTYSPFVSPTVSSSSNKIAYSGEVDFEPGFVTWNSTENPSLLEAVQDELTTANKKFSFIVQGYTANSKSDVYFYSKDQSSGSTALDSVPVLIITQKKTTESTLPVTMSSLSVAYDQLNSVVNLNWYTLSESDLKNFGVWRSSDGISFKRIGTVLPVGNSLQQTKYNYSDTLSENGTYFYQIRAESLDGSYDNSNIARIKASLNDAALLTVSPNPARAFIYVTSSMTGTGKIIDMSGKAMKQLSITAGQRLMVDVSGWGKGTYLLTIENSSDKLLSKFIVL